MKLNANTIEILKNFAAINDNLVVNSGNVLTTISEAKNIVAEATIEETFPTKFGIYDLSEFIGVYSLLDSPDIAFSNSELTLSSGRKAASYRYADPSILTHPKSKVNMPPVEVSVKISAADLSAVSKGASTLGHSFMNMSGRDGVVSLAVCDPKNASANSFSITIDDDNVCKESFSLHFLISNLKLVSGEYTVHVGRNANGRPLSQWVHSNGAVVYYIALEDSSTFGN